MQRTIRIPALTRIQRLAIGLSVTMLLIAFALPASAAAPEGIEGEVTVVNDATDPVPVTGSVDAAVTGSVGITGSVAATQSGTWTVG